jgi:hypothetical protein
MSSNGQEVLDVDADNEDDNGDDDCSDGAAAFDDEEEEENKRRRGTMDLGTTKKAKEKK